MQKTLEGNSIKMTIPKACSKYTKGIKCGGDLEGTGNRFKCTKCGQITIIQDLV